MEIQIDRNEERLTVRKITVFTGNKEFEIEIDKFGELIITKEQYGKEEIGNTSELVTRKRYVLSM